MKVLVTGSLGHIASRVLPLMSDRFDLALTDIREGILAGQRVVSLDITDYAAVQEAAQGMDAILHLAIASEGRYRTNEFDEYIKFNQASIEANVRGTYHIYEAALQNRVPRVVYGSSLTIFLGTPAYEMVRDDLAPRTSSFYAVTKLWGEQLGEYFSRSHGLRVYCLRFGTPHPWVEHPKFRDWLTGPVGRRTLVTYADLAGAMMAALEAEGPLFGAYTVVSDTDGNAFDFSKGTEIGWTPQNVIDDGGAVSRREDALTVLAGS